MYGRMKYLAINFLIYNTEVFWDLSIRWDGLSLMPGLKHPFCLLFHNVVRVSHMLLVRSNGPDDQSNAENAVQVSLCEHDILSSG